MKIKAKDIVAIVVSLIVVGISIYFVFNMLGGSSKSNAEQTSTEVKVEIFPSEDDINNDTLEAVESLTDYGKPTLDNIGRSNPFDPVQ